MKMETKWKKEKLSMGLSPGVKNRDRAGFPTPVLVILCK